MSVRINPDVHMCGYCISCYRTDYLAQLDATSICRDVQQVKPRFRAHFHCVGESRPQGFTKRYHASVLGRTTTTVTTYGLPTFTPVVNVIMNTTNL